MRTVSRTLLYCAAAVLKQCRLLDRDRRLKVGFEFIRFQVRTLEETHGDIQNIHVTSNLDIMARRVGKPQHIVRTPCAETFTRRQMPPMLHVSFDELP